MLLMVEKEECHPIYQYAKANNNKYMKIKNPHSSIFGCK